MENNQLSKLQTWISYSFLSYHTHYTTLHVTWYFCEFGITSLNEMSHKTTMKVPLTGRNKNKNGTCLHFSEK